MAKGASLARSYLLNDTTVTMKQKVVNTFTRGSTLWIGVCFLERTSRWPISKNKDSIVPISSLFEQDRARAHGNHFGFLFWKIFIPKPIRPARASDIAPPRRPEIEVPAFAEGQTSALPFFPSLSVDCSSFCFRKS